MNSNGEANGNYIHIEEVPSGRILRPVGSIYRLVSKRLSEMTDPELSSFIQEMKLQVKQAELSLDQKRVHLSQATAEQEGREFELRRRLRNIRISPAGIKVKANQSTRDSWLTIVNKWRASGKSDREIYDLLAKLQQAVGGKS